MTRLRLAVISTEVALDHVLLVGNDGGELVELFFAQIAGAAIRVKTGFCDDGLRTCGPMP